MPQEVDAITRIYDYRLWVIPKPEKFPRSQKFLLADRIENLLLDALQHGSTVGWGEERTPTMCHETGGMQCGTGAHGLMAAHIFSP